MKLHAFSILVNELVLRLGIDSHAIRHHLCHLQENRYFFYSQEIILCKLVRRRKYGLNNVTEYFFELSILTGLSSKRKNFFQMEYTHWSHLRNGIFFSN
jgi:hypothetical protein